MSVPDRPAYQLYQWLWSGLDWIYPPHCGGCGGVGARWCADCQSQVSIVPLPYCDHCGIPQRKPGVCSRCSQNPPQYTAARSWALFAGPLRKAMHRLKYKRDIALGEILAQPLGRYFVELGWQVEAVVPVPMGKERLGARGYNQAAYLARPLALDCGLAYRPQWLRKARETATQVGLSMEQRKKNVAGAFVADDEAVSSRAILLVDDVTTSGATLDSCAHALCEAGASRVYCLTLARAL